MKAAIFDAFSGMAGDMTLGAFLDAGFDFSLLKSELKKLGLRGYSLTSEKTRRGVFSGTKFTVHIKHSLRHGHTHLSEIRRLILKSRLHPNIKKISIRIFETLGRAEAKVHGLQLEKISFHEVGAIDSIVDIVGTAVCVHHLGLGRIFVRNLHVGGGSLRTHHHGRMILPTPGASELLKGFEVSHAPIDFEMVTPTGAAILAALAEKTGDLPCLEIQAIGYGAGTMEFKDRPNLLRVTLGETVKGFSRDRILVLETNLDDMNPLGFEILYRRLFKAGALDVYVVPILMKKMRPAYKLSVLLEPSLKDKISETVFKETTTFGVRFLELDRLILKREIIKIPTRFGKISVKTGSLDGCPHIVSPEYEDCKKHALARGLAFREVYREAKERALAFLKVHPQQK